MNKQYNYFVVYDGNDGKKSYSGNVDVTFDKKIDSIEDIRKIEEHIKENIKLKELHISNYQLLGTSGEVEDNE